MSVKILSRVWENSIQKGSPLLTLLALADWSNDYGSSWYGVKKIADRTRLSSRNIQRIIAALNETRDLYVCGECSELGTNIYVVTTSMSGEDIMEALIHPPFNFDTVKAWEIAQSVVLRPNRLIKVGGDKMSGVTNPIKKRKNMSPDPSLNSNHQIPRKRDLFFDTVARDYFGVNLNDPASVKLVAKRVARIKKELLSADENLTADELANVAFWLRRTRPGLSMPQHEQSIGQSIIEYRNMHKDLSNGNGHVYTLDPNDPTLPENDWVKPHE